MAMQRCLPALTNHLAPVFRVPGQKFFGWLLSGMAITNDLATVIWWLSQMASSFISCLTSRPVEWLVASSVVVSVVKSEERGARSRGAGQARGGGVEISGVLFCFSPVPRNSPC